MISDFTLGSKQAVARLSAQNHPLEQQWAHSRLFKLEAALKGKGNKLVNLVPHERSCEVPRELAASKAPRENFHSEYSGGGAGDLHALGILRREGTPRGALLKYPQGAFFAPPLIGGLFFLTSKSRTQKFNRQVLWPWRLRWWPLLPRVWWK